jgi:hypothetical protein
VTDHDDVREVLRRLNEGWLNHPPEKIPAAMEELWHQDASIVVLGVQEMARGREACIRSYVDFVRQATVEDSHLSEPSIDVWGDVAVASSRWEMTYALDGERLSETGHETFVLIRTGDGWRIVWRAIVPTAAP